MIAATEEESSIMMRENNAIKTTLSISGIKNMRSQNQKLPTDQPTIFLSPQEHISLGNLTISDSTQRERFTAMSVDLGTENDTLSSHINNPLTQNSSITNSFPETLNMPYISSTLSGSHVSIQFDKFVNAHCLHISESSRSSFGELGKIDPSKPLPPLPGQVSVPQCASQSSSPDLSIIAINFILA